MLLERLIGRTFFVARTDGMRPAIFAGDVVAVRVPRDRRWTYAVGDVVACRGASDARLTARRISDVVSDPAMGITYLVHEDDAPLEVRSPLLPNQIVGRVEARHVNLGRFWNESRNCRSKAALTSVTPAPNVRRDNVARGN